MRYRMTAEDVRRYIAEVEELPATSDDPAVDTIEKRITAATAPNAGSVYRLNASVMGPDVLEDITKLAILIKVYNDKMGESASSALEDVEKSLERITSTGEMAGGKYQWTNGTVTASGSHSYRANGLISEFIPISAVTKLKYTGETESPDGYQYGCYVVQYNTADVAGFISRTVACYPGTETPEVEIDEDCKYIRLLIISASASIEESEGDGWSNTTTINSLVALQNATAADKTEIEELLADIYGAVSYGRYPVMTAGTAIQHATGNEYNNTYFSCSGFVCVSGHTSILYRNVITNSSSPAFGMAFYDANKGYIKGFAAASSTALGYRDDIVEIPENAAFVRFSYWTTWEARGYPPFRYKLIENYSNSIQKRLSDVEAKTEGARSSLGLHDTPYSPGVLNVVRRARQLTDVEWTPAVDLPRMNMTMNSNGYYLGVFKAGHKYKGIPYIKTRPNIGDGGVYVHADEYPAPTEYGKDHLYVGLKGLTNGGVDIGTFVTSAENADSRLCTEFVTDASVKKYHNALFLGTVCSALSSYAFDLPVVKITDNIDDAAYFDPIVDSGNTVSELYAAGKIDLLQIGHLVNAADVHSSLCTDVQRDSNGHIIYVEISEATPVGVGNANADGGDTGGVCRRKAYPVEEFVKRFGVYGIYARKNIDSVTYTPCPYVNVGDEFDWYSLRDLPIMPYEGNTFAYKVTTESGRQIAAPGNRIRLIFNNSKNSPWEGESAHTFNRIRVYKGASLYGEYSIGASDTHYDFVPNGSDADWTGDYTAEMVRVSGATVEEKTVQCSFSIIN